MPAKTPKLLKMLISMTTSITKYGSVVNCYVFMPKCEPGVTIPGVPSTPSPESL